MSAAEERELPRRRDLPALGAALGFMRVLWRLDHALQRTSKRMGASLGVTGPQRLVLRIVGRQPGILAGQLATILHVHPSTLTGILKRLERQGLLLRRVDPRDRRRAVLELSAKGRRLESRTEGTVETTVRLALAELPAETTRHAAKALTLLAAKLEKIALR